MMSSVVCLLLNVSVIHGGLLMLLLQAPKFAHEKTIEVMKLFAENTEGEKTISKNNNNLF